MRDRYGNKYRWEIRWDPRKPFYEKDTFLDGGTIFWHIGLITIYKWFVYEE